MLWIVGAKGSCERVPQDTVNHTRVRHVYRLVCTRMKCAKMY